MTAPGPRIFDRPADIANLDSENVLGAVERFAEQCRAGWEIGRAAEGLPNGDGVESVLVLGMGGSGISGNVVHAILEDRLRVPFEVLKSYGPLPEWVGRNTLVFAVSYSGSTEETIAAFTDAHDRGSRAVAVSSGGALAEMAREYGVAHVAIPSGLQPRASLGYLALPILAVLGRIGIVPDLHEDVDEAEEVLTALQARCHRDRPTRDNPAKHLAEAIYGRIPVVYGGHGATAVAAERFKCDLNEYSKTPAFWNRFPELNHNEIVGWSQFADITKQSFMGVWLRDKEEHPRVTLRFEITKRLIGDKLGALVEVPSEGHSATARLLSHILVTQLASIYLGLAYGIDPGPIEVIQQLKKELADR